MRVLEARDRVGGRVFDVEIVTGLIVELGAAWVGADQSRALKLLAEYGISTFPSALDGDGVLLASDGTAHILPGGFPSDSPVVGEVMGALEHLDRWAETATTSAESHAAAETTTCSAWIDSLELLPDSAVFIRATLQGLLGADLSMAAVSNVLMILSAAGGIAAAMENTDGMRVDGGFAQLADRIADELRCTLILGARVTSIVDSGAKVNVAYDVGSGRAEVQASVVIVTVPPNLIRSIGFEPPLPAAVDQAIQHHPGGNVTKSMLVYSSPWWRDDSLSGSVITDGGSFAVAIDASPDDGPYGVLALLSYGQMSSRLLASDDGEITETLMPPLVAALGPRASELVACIQHNWSEDAFTRGGYGVVRVPGTPHNGRTLPSSQVAIGRLIFASADTDERWPGYVDGAIGSGAAAAITATRLLPLT